MFNELRMLRDELEPFFHPAIELLPAQVFRFPTGWVSGPATH
ncbi:MAG: hypothetical protein U0573_02405 [Phycisphaerales bacterium]